MQMQAALRPDQWRTGLLPLLACPSCHTPGKVFSSGDNCLECRQCGSSFPVFSCGRASIPWFFSDPDATLLQWKARFRGFLELNALEQARITRGLADENISRLAMLRMEKLLSARCEHRDQMLELLGPLSFDQAKIADTPDPIALLENKVAKNQGLSSYQDNIFRDWAWNNGENEAQLRAIEAVLRNDSRDRLGKVLTLGAGACRLPYDLHRNYYADLSVVVDINPALLFLASRVIHGETVKLNEFPIAPLNTDCCAVLRHCHAPQPIDDYGAESFQFLFADAMDPPFEPASFDTVFTPWLIDIMPQDLSTFMPRVNRLLPKGGVWLNTGSLAFFRAQEAECYSEDEVLSMVERFGFRITAVNRRTMPYMHSPASAHGRSENVLTFTAVKLRDVPVAKEYRYLPEHLLNSSLPVPENPDFTVLASGHLLKAQVLSAIDGERSADEITRLIARQYGLLTGEAAHAVRTILTEAAETTASRDSN